MANNRDLSFEKSVKYFVYMMKPKLILLALLMLVLYNENGFHAVQGEIHTEVMNGELHVKTPTQLLGRIEFDPDSTQDSEESPSVGPFIGNGEFIQSEINIKKRSCERPSIITHGLLGTTLKRSYFAAHKEEVEEKLRQLAKVEHQMKKKHGEISGGPLPWSCETHYEWRDMGADHYPRFIRTAECTAKFCVRGFYRCKPRRYKTKVLRRVTATESSMCEDDSDVSLPEQLRSSWRFITVTINLCCDCTGPGRVLNMGMNMGVV